MKRFIFLITALSLCTLILSAQESADSHEFIVDDLHYKLLAHDFVSVVGYSHNSHLGNLTIPSTVSVGEKAYSVIEIADSAFYDCISLKSIHIPASVWFFPSGDVFAGCDSLMSITVADGNQYYDSRSGCNAVIETSSNKLVAGCMKTVVPNTVVSIGDYAFAERSNLRFLDVPESVRSVGDYAFFGCHDLVDVNFKASIKNVKQGKYVFGDCPRYWIQPESLPIPFD